MQPRTENRVQETADDAALSKLSAVRMGYYVDPFLPFFVRKFTRRSPLINRGYYARVAAIDALIRRFLAIARRTGDGRSQVVVLGAGMDTAFWRFHAEACASNPSSASGVAPVRPSSLWIELDFPEITSRKAATIRKNELLFSCVAGKNVSAADIAAAPGPISSSNDGSAAAPPASSPPPASSAAVTFTSSATGGCNVTGASGYRLITADLRDIAALNAAIASAGGEPSVPTLVLSECVLVYLEPEESCAIIAWAARAFARSVFITYEQVRPHDAFGQVMARNLEERGYTLRGLNAFPDLPSQAARYRELGYGSSSVADMNDVYYRLLPRGDVARMERLEIFDEVEEWHLISAHYSLAIAVNESNGVHAVATAATAAASVTTAAAAAATVATATAMGGTGTTKAPPRGIDLAFDITAPHASQLPNGTAAAAASADAADEESMPPPKAVRAVGASIARISAPRVTGSSSVVEGGLSPPQAVPDLSPRELAAVVVRAHEARSEAESAARRSRSRSGSLRSVSPSPASSMDRWGGGLHLRGGVDGVSLLGGGGVGEGGDDIMSTGGDQGGAWGALAQGGAGSGGGGGGGGVQRPVAAAVLRDASGGVVVGDGHVDTVYIMAGGGGALSGRTALSATSPAGGHTMNGNSHHAAAADAAPSSRLSSGGFSPGSDKGLHSLGDAVSASAMLTDGGGGAGGGSVGGGGGSVAHHGGGGLLPDFASMEQAEDELERARHVREASGMDYVRDALVPAADAAAAAAAAVMGGDSGGAAVTANAQGGGSGSGSGSLYAPAVEASRLHAKLLPGAGGEGGSGGGAGGGVSLLELLLPTEQWAPPTPSSAQAHAHAHSRAHVWMPIALR